MDLNDDWDYFAQPLRPTLEIRGKILIQPKSTQPLFTISGTGTRQRIGIVQSERNFVSTTSAQWNRLNGNPRFAPIWDVSHDGRSDVEYALQCTPFLLKDGLVIWRGTYDSGDLTRWRGRGQRWEWVRTAWYTWLSLMARA